MIASEAIASGAIGGRLWFYTNFHCNLTCRYCLTESRPGAPRRLLDGSTILRIADEAVALGFRAFGVTGGEPFLRPDMPDLLCELGRRLPTVVLTNGTLFSDGLRASIDRFAALPIAIQISLDSADPSVNDDARGGFARVREAIPQLIAAGIRVRIASTVDDADVVALESLCVLHRALGIGDDDHVVRPIIKRGRAAQHDLGIVADFADLPAELTITADGAFWSPAAPTVSDDRLDLDFLLTRTIDPVRVPLDAMLRVAGMRERPETAPRIT